MSVTTSTADRSTPRRVREDQLAVLVDSGAIRSVAVERTGPDRWAVRLRIGMQEAVIASHRAPVRTWGSLDTLAAWLQRQGIGHFEVRAA